jgi:hypothetical protein
MPPTRINHYLCTILILAAATSAAADAEDVIAACARIPSTGDRILCLENALRRLGGGQYTPGQAESPVEASETTSPSDIPTSDAQELAATTNVTAPEPSSDPVSATAGGGAESFGLPPARSQPQRPDSVLVNVTSVRQNPYGKLIFSTDTGQEWLQTDQASRRFPDIPFDAEIRVAASGSFFLRRASGGPSVRVRRQK